MVSKVVASEKIGASPILLLLVWGAVLLWLHRVTTSGGAARTVLVVVEHPA